jgi:hypothetical protein
MLRAARAALVAIVLLAVTPLTACRYSTVHLLLPDFESSSIEGFRVWKLHYGSGTYEEVVRVEFTELVEEEGGETLVYRSWKNGRWVMTGVPVPIERIQGYPDAALLRPVLPGLGNGAYRFSTFNAAGDSALSQGWLTF